MDKKECKIGDWCLVTNLESPLNNLKVLYYADYDDGRILVWFSGQFYHDCLIYPNDLEYVESLDVSTHTYINQYHKREFKHTLLLLELIDGPAWPYPEYIEWVNNYANSSWRLTDESL